ncbi:hypothetical protein [Saprospira grandis]|uniref:Uncharacterized protein n=1 Tax=Saprospira grandis (strain Lewin) TaxID=984262 RepID=H6L8M6_SAPGL|nr:hypothetical protein [Saprospira grandis]AFC26751.1 hypothetical protein SGRA_4036 [Saprospira grandis str. Lewin]
MQALSAFARKKMVHCNSFAVFAGKIMLHCNPSAHLLEKKWSIATLLLYSLEK